MSARSIGGAAAIIAAGIRWALARAKARIARDLEIAFYGCVMPKPPVYSKATKEPVRCGIVGCTVSS